MAKPTEYIRKLMKDRILRKIDLENLSGLSRASIERHVRGAKEPNLEQRAKYAQAFGMTLAEFEAGWQAYNPPLFDVVDHEIQYGDGGTDHALAPFRRFAKENGRTLKDVLEEAIEIMIKGNPKGPKKPAPKPKK